MKKNTAQCITVFLLLAWPPAADCQSSAPIPSSLARIQQTQSECSQPASERSALIREAETDKYTLRRIVMVGNRQTRDGVLRRSIGIGLQEGEFFTRRKLIRGLKNVSKLKVMYPARLRDVVVELNRAEKTIDIHICFREKP